MIISFFITLAIFVAIIGLILIMIFAPWVLLGAAGVAVFYCVWMVVADGMKKK